MIRIVSIFLFFSLILLVPNPTFADDNNFGQHFGWSAIMGVFGETTVHERETFNVPMKILVGTVIGTVPGVIKEIFDGTESDNHFSEEQVLYDVMGSAVGSIIAYKYNSRTKVNVSGTEGGAIISLLHRY